MAEKESKKRKRGQGEGTIYPRKDGRWAAAVITGYKNGKLQRKNYYGKTRAEVAKKLNDALNKQEHGLPLVGETQTVKQFLLEWVENSVKPATRLSTFISYNQQVEQHIIPEIGHIKLAKLSPQDVQRMIKNLMAKNRQSKKKDDNERLLSNRTVSYCVTVLRMALKKAEAFGLVSRNVAKLVEPPRIERKEITPMDVDEAQKFLKLLEGDRLEALFRVGLALGLRRGEALALKWSNIDFEGATLRVSGSLQRLNHDLLILPPKTKKSARQMSIPKSLLPILREHRTRQLEERLKAKYWQDHDLVFCTTLGTPIEPRNVRRKLDALMKDSGMRYFRLHDMRHFFASLLLAQGVELKVVSELLGHASIQITADTYAHLLPKIKEQAIDLLDAVLTGTK